MYTYSKQIQNMRDKSMYRRVWMLTIRAFEIRRTDMARRRVRLQWGHGNPLDSGDRPNIGESANVNKKRKINWKRKQVLSHPNTSASNGLFASALTKCPASHAESMAGCQGYLNAFPSEGLCGCWQNVYINILYISIYIYIIHYRRKFRS